MHIRTTEAKKVNHGVEPSGSNRHSAYAVHIFVYIEAMHIVRFSKYAMYIKHACLRSYPPAFGRRLFEIWRDAPETPNTTLRTGYSIMFNCMHVLN